MMIYFNLLVAIIGVLIYVVSSNAKIGELGRVMFWTGLLTFLLQFGGSRVVEGR